jgi:hypothetical protein
MATTYEQAYSDHCYLWQEYGPAEDMTGGYVDQEDLAKLLKSPTKATARDCLVNQIDHWFMVGPDSTAHQPDWSDARLQEIAERYNHEVPV